MRTKQNLLFLVLFLPFLLPAQGSYTILGTYPQMDRFYRNMPLLPENYYNNSASLLLQVPAFMTDPAISFPYQKRAYQYEQLFTDNVNIVRFLGGWSALKNKTTIADISQWDLAYRDTNGAIKYRWNLIPARLDPIMQMGFNSPNIVLDNTPWCFPLLPAEPASGSLGQYAPPANLTEWSTFISDLCTELVRLYGYDRVNTWGFRLGTEVGSTARFNGTAQQYNDFYKSTALAVKLILPSAKVFPYNRASEGTANLMALLSDARANNYSYSVSALSTYSIALSDTTTGLLKTSTVDPDAKATSTTQMWYDMNAVTPFSSLTHEIHEYGWFLNNELGDGDSAPGARGAAGNFHYMMNLRQRGVEKLYHWSVNHPTTDWTKILLTSQGYIFAIWDYCTGARTVELNKTLKTTPQSTQLYKSVGFFNSTGKSYIMVSGYNMDRKQLNRNEISVYIPKSEFYDANPKVTFTTLNDSTDAYRMLRNDLLSLGVLNAAYAADSTFVPNFNTMSTLGKWYLQLNNDKYTSSIKQSLTLKPFNGKVQITSDGTILTFSIRTPELFTIALEKNTLSSIASNSSNSNALTVYPNPVKNKLYFSAFSSEMAQIYTMDGAKKMEQELNGDSGEIDLSRLASGVYLLKLKHNGVVGTEKIVKL